MSLIMTSNKNVNHILDNIGLEYHVKLDDVKINKDIIHDIMNEFTEILTSKNCELSNKSFTFRDEEFSFEKTIILFNQNEVEDEHKDENEVAVDESEGEEDQEDSFNDIEEIIDNMSDAIIELDSIFKVIYIHVALKEPKTEVNYMMEKGEHNEINQSKREICCRWNLRCKFLLCRHQVKIFKEAISN